MSRTRSIQRPRAARPEAGRPLRWRAAAGLSVAVALVHGGLLLLAQRDPGLARRATHAADQQPRVPIVALLTAPTRMSTKAVAAPADIAPTRVLLASARPRRPSAERAAPGVAESASGIDRPVAPDAATDAPAGQEPQASADASATPPVVANGAAEGAAAPSPAGEAELPVYPTRLPPAANLAYTLRVGAVSGTATLRWEPLVATPQAAGRPGYALVLRSQLPGRPAQAWSSQGALDDHGLVPLRYAESRRGREQRATNFQPSRARVSFSGPTVELPWVPGSQDRVSWLLQLAGVMAANPALAQVGQRVTLFVVGTRGAGRAWAFEVVGPEVLAWPGGGLPTLLLRREPDRAYDTRAEVWLDPARGHLPVRVRWQAPPALAVSELLLAEETPAEQAFVATP